jgi:serine/threonine protein kinase
VCQLGPHYDFVKLLDFGIVRTTSGPGPTETSAGQIKGTPTSLSPEVIKGEQATSAADIYGLGCVAYWLLSGQHVFDAPSLMALLVKHMSQTPKPLSEHRSDVPNELDEMVLRCLAKDPGDRPGNAFELGELLASIPFRESWDNRLAENWWNENLPDTSESGQSGFYSETIVMNSGDTGSADTRWSSPE